MIAAAITALKSRTGSSRQAILKYITENYMIDATKAAIQLRLALKRGVATGTINPAKESGKGARCYKVAKIEKPKTVKKVMKLTTKHTMENSEWKIFTCIMKDEI